MLMEKRMQDMQVFTVNLLPVLLRTLSDPSDTVVLLDLQVLSRISLAVANRADSNDLGDSSQLALLNTSMTTDKESSIDGKPGVSSAGLKETEEAQFQIVLNAILNLFAQDRQLLETRGSLIIRKLCVLLNAKAVYIRMAETLSSYEFVHKDNNDQQDHASTLQFISTMVQTLNLILLTASELHDLRSTLANSFEDSESNVHHQRSLSSTSSVDSDDNGNVFATLFHCWCHNPVATFSLCLLAKAYDLSFALVKRFSDMENISVGFLMQIDKLVHLLESPIFVHLRLQLLNIEAPYHAHLLKSIYGVLMCLPQGEAFRLLNDRLTTVCNLRDNLGVSSNRSSFPNAALTSSSNSTVNGMQNANAEDMDPIVSKRGLDMDKLLDRFDSVTEQHREAKDRAQKITIAAERNAFTETVISSPGRGFGDGLQQQVPALQNSVSLSSIGRGAHSRLTPITTNMSMAEQQSVAPTRITVHQSPTERHIR